MIEIEQLDCEDDTGQRYTIAVRQSFETHRLLADEGGRSAGTIHYILDDESDVTPLGDGRSFNILDTVVVTWLVL